MKDANENRNDTSAPRKLTVEDLKKIIGGMERSRIDSYEYAGNRKVGPT